MDQTRRQICCYTFFRFGNDFAKTVYGILQTIFAVFPFAIELQHHVGPFRKIISLYRKTDLVIPEVLMFQRFFWKLLFFFTHHTQDAKSVFFILINCLFIGRNQNTSPYLLFQNLLHLKCSAFRNRSILIKHFFVI